MTWYVAAGLSYARRLLRQGFTQAWDLVLVKGVAGVLVHTHMIYIYILLSLSLSYVYDSVCVYTYIYI